MKATVIDGQIIEVSGCTNCPFFRGMTYFGEKDPILGYCHHPEHSIIHVVYNGMTGKVTRIRWADPIKKGFVCPLREAEECQ